LPSNQFEYETPVTLGAIQKIRALLRPFSDPLDLVMTFFFLSITDFKVSFALNLEIINGRKDLINPNLAVKQICLLSKALFTLYQEAKMSL
jgi:hypothetical protein